MMAGQSKARLIALISRALLNVVLCRLMPTVGLTDDVEYGSWLWVSVYRWRDADYERFGYLSLLFNCIAEG